MQTSPTFHLFVFSVFLKNILMQLLLQNDSNKMIS